MAALTAATAASFIFAAVARAAVADIAPTTFQVLDPSTSKVIGQVRFTVTQQPRGAETVRSEAHYRNGDYDSEEDHLIPGAGGGPLKQISFSHSFFRPNGSPDRSSQANFVTGQASCTTMVNGLATVKSADFQFGTDTYAGAPVVIPLRHALMAQAQSMEFHYFTCVPDPRVVSVVAQPDPPAPWQYAHGAVVKVDLQPDFGWLNDIIAPFLPSVGAWFDPSRQWFLVGVESARYYRGPKILMVDDPPPPAPR
jgi:hypothetical protein